MRPESKLPSPPLEEGGNTMASKRAKPARVEHRVSKRSSTATTSSYHAPTSPLDHHSPQSATDGARHKRVWKACERCRMKKTKCDGEHPCKRCKDDGLVCTLGVRRKTDFKTLPRGYAEVLEHSQYTLVATVHKLYTMVRNRQPWVDVEPDLNDAGAPVIHSIADILGCIRPNIDIDLPAQSKGLACPETKEDMVTLASFLDTQQKLDDQTNGQPPATSPVMDNGSPDEQAFSETEDFQPMRFPERLASDGTLASPGLDLHSLPLQQPPPSPYDNMPPEELQAVATPIISTLDHNYAQPWNSQVYNPVCRPYVANMEFASPQYLGSNVLDYRQPRFVNPPVMMNGRDDPMMSPGYTDTYGPPRL